jgi:O-acetyl-ADP-ribose deacetylase (regulator of RNase III)
MKEEAIKQIIEILQGDITKISVDAIVNAANRSLMGGGGVDGAIHRAGGPVILQECKGIVAKQGQCETGQAVITSAGALPAKHVIHTVGPIWSGGQRQERILLAHCYQNSLALASDNHCHTISFPNISTGVYGFPKSDAAVISLDTVMNSLNQYHGMEKVYFVCFDEENYFLMKEYYQDMNFG